MYLLVGPYGTLGMKALARHLEKAKVTATRIQIVPQYLRSRPDDLDMLVRQFDSGNIGENGEQSAETT